MSESKRVVGYVRVSTEDQADQGVSLADQRRRIQQYAELYELELIEVIEDAGASAKSLNRPGIARALELLSAGQAEGLLVAKLDRLTRSVRDLGELLEGPLAGRDLLSVAEQLDTSSAAGRMVTRMLAVVSEWEREAIGERTSAALQHMKQQGRRVGAVPYGYQLAEDGQHLVEHSAEQEVLEQARELRAAGLSLRAVADELAERGFLSRTGRTFAATQIKRMVDAA